MKKLPDASHREKIWFGALSASHLLADLLGAVMPGILPEVMLVFGLELGEGVLLLSVLGMAANWLQIPASLLTGKIPPRVTLIAGLLLASAILALPFCPANTGFGSLLMLMIATGLGIAMVHPAGVTEVQSLTALPGKTAIPIYMTCGFFGAAAGPWIASLAVESRGMPGLFWFFLPVALVNALLAVGGRKKTFSAPGKPPCGAEPLWSFGALFLVATLMNGGTAILTGLLPTMLHEAGFSLGFGGFCNMLFGAGSSIGSIALGMMARKVPQDKLILTGFVPGIVIGALYLAAAPLSPWCCIAVFLMGMLLSAEYPLLVALSGTARGAFSPALRSALIVGGAWGIAGALLLPAGKIAAGFGLTAALASGLALYAAVFGVAVVSRRGKSAPKHASMQ